MEETFPTDGIVLVDVENDIGLVVVNAIETSTTTVRLEPDTAGAEELVARATVECRSSGGRDIIRVRIPRMHGMKFLRRNGVTVRIEVPAGADLDIKTGSADVELNGTVGDVTVKSGSGDVTGDRANGDVRVATASSDLVVESVAGHLHFHTASGDLRADRIEGGLSMSTASGDVEVGSVFQRVDVRATSGDVRLGEVLGDAAVVAVSGDVRVLSYGAGRLQVRSVSGDLTVGIPHGTSFEIDAESMSGDVRSEIPLANSPGVAGDAPEVTVIAERLG